MIAVWCVVIAREKVCEEHKSSAVGVSSRAKCDRDRIPTPTIDLLLNVSASPAAFIGPRWPC